ncbi:hypothetical protein BVX98_04355 [bacterium F11]|nr:hypothetical protein BVX98_04355 [bacterium F11]
MSNKTTSPHPKFDTVVIGAGIIGLSIAYELNRRFPSHGILVLEKEDTPGLHASGRNSGVLHTGIYYSPNSLKAKICHTGRFLMEQFAIENKIPIKKTGKVIIPTNENELASLDRLMTNAQKNGVNAQLLSEVEIRKIEPFARPYQKGIHCPDVSVIEGKAVLSVLYQILTSRGVHIETNKKVCRIDEENKILTTSDGAQVGYGYFINAAGAFADVIAKKVGLSRDHIMVPFKGMYFKLREEKSSMVRSSIYPVPNLSFPFLGVHFTRIVSGGVYVGPTATPAFGRENYGVIKGIRLSESFSIFTHLIQLYINNQQNFRKLTHQEMGKYFKTYFLKHAQKLVSDLDGKDLIRSPKVGIRPQLVNLKEKRLEMDFVIEQKDGSLHILNAISPAFTCAFSFSKWLIDNYLEKP